MGTLTVPVNLSNDKNLFLVKFQKLSAEFSQTTTPPIGNKPFFFAGFLKIFGAES
ncbi:hypothetical protein LEP1GSC161_2402 [Leptospira santarosai str. CBC1416]|uniref:Uncharacterized protein n=3 Tax=Leptospira santarosai TaxID=28183 RepID=M6VBY9_9LEPT|nr:hypothetical protein LEP1GSC179_2003 [Leptospira santarosai str. MOR084]EKO78235.1 hypothetical protein LEP1GSC068_3849 [Leptospira sp. Fiocruz LV3954]EKS07539.1 hypothetical protein LEP1GSC071_0869 [Leptospira santarosai str. JET]EMI62447.1 hypothetical protein LEP1GSC076_3925 [Leptospira sp. Fiocruz LV4135]EMM76819.1 hypothetical protein LEP1GSC040_0969 [Leptospira santarosai str. 2000030832]EMM86741.1 hypothetical protein LEP1GSC039_3677 [Leptospira santarosai str. 2000027870]EMO14801.1